MNTFIMTTESMNVFLSYQKDKGVSDNMYRRFSCAIRSLYEYLPEDKSLTKERLVAWRKSLDDSGYASITVLNYVKYINIYLDYVGASEIRFNRGHPKDITGMTFGYLTALEPTEKRDRKDVVWRCQCKCGKIVELPATRLLIGNTKSCGCLQIDLFQRANKYIDNTSLRQALAEDPVKSERGAVSGYTGVVPKRGKWAAYITYKGKNYSLGSYAKIEDAVKARARGKELVRQDAMGLLDFYEEIHKSDDALPSRATTPKIEFPASEWRVKDQPCSAAKRTDNTSGYTGVSFRKGKWEARICYQKVLYKLGRFKEKEEAVAARQTAEKALLENPEEFVAQYSEKFLHYDMVNYEKA